MPIKPETKNLLAYLARQPRGFAYGATTPTTKQDRLAALRNCFAACIKCPLATQGRIQVVFGQGNSNALLMFVGEGPGADEDREGMPFIGKAGRLLTKIIEAMGLSRGEVYITNVVKCRPPCNRAPLPDQSEICKKLILAKEIEIIKPKIICTLGATATQAILGPTMRIGKARGNFFTINNNRLVMPTFHPAYLLRNPASKAAVWADMQKIMAHLEIQ